MGGVRTADGAWVKFCGRRERRLPAGERELSVDPYGQKVPFLPERPKGHPGGFP